MTLVRKKGRAKKITALIFLLLDDITIVKDIVPAMAVFVEAGRVTIIMSRLSARTRRAVKGIVQRSNTERVDGLVLE